MHSSCITTIQIWLLVQLVNDYVATQRAI